MTGTLCKCLHPFETEEELAREIVRLRELLAALLADALTLMDQTTSPETQLEARRRIIERHGTRPSDG